MSASQSPPRKRVRNLRTTTTAGSSSSSSSQDIIEVTHSRQRRSGSMIHNNVDDAVAGADNVHEKVVEHPPPVAAASAGGHSGGSKSRKMRLQQKNRSRLRSSASSNGAAAVEDGAPILGDVAPAGGMSDEETNDVSSSDESCLSAALVRKVKRRAHLSSTDHEIVRLIGQHLTNIGLKTSADVLMQEAGCRLDQPSAATFKKFVLSGDWSQAVKALEDLRNHLENPEHLVEMKFLLLEQKYLEYLSRGNPIDAIKVLQTELTPLKHNQARTHELSSYLMYSDPDDIARLTQSVSLKNGNTGSSTSNSVSCVNGTGVCVEVNARAVLMERLQAYLPAAIMLPPRRLLTLLSQAAHYQTELCLYHNRAMDSPVLDSSYLAVDHMCPRQDFPCETIQVLTDHCEEVWYCRFSPNGLKLATGSKDNTVIIWDFNPETLSLKMNKTLERHSHGVAYFAWSPDSTRLAVCGPEDCDEVWVWNVDSGLMDFKISHSTEDSLTTVSWSPDGRKIVCGGNRGQFYQCDTKGSVQESWEGIRVQCLAFRKDGKTVLAADTHHRIRAYNFEELSDSTVLHEDHGIMTFTLDSTDRYALVNIATQGIHLWDIEDKCLIRKFVGITQGFYTIYSCFGGAGQNFIASGSEDNKVYIYHIKKEAPIVVLNGHSRTVNCVAWNPVYPRVLVSTSDDCTVRVWGPAERYRNTVNGTLATSSSASNLHHQNGNSDGHLDGQNNFSNGVM